METEKTESLTICVPSISGKIEQAIYDYVYNTFGRSEAQDPSWYIPDLAKAVSDALKDQNYEAEHEITYEND